MCAKMEATLVCHPGKEMDLMSESEFLIGADEVVMAGFDQLERHLFRQSLATNQQLLNNRSTFDSLTVRQLARILFHQAL